MNTEADFREATELMLRYLEGLASPEQARRLSDLMRQSRPVRRHCTIMLRQHLQLFEIAEAQAAQMVEENAAVGGEVIALRRDEEHGWFSDWRWWAGGLTAAAAAIIIMLSLAGHITTKPSVELSGVELEVKAADRLVLAKNSTTLAVGQKVSARRVAVESGSVNFRVSSGVTIAASGPVEMEFLDGMQVRLVRGQLTAEVEPQARGFSVLTPNGRVVDLGTRFGVGLERNVGADVVVFTGKVEVHKNDAPAEQRPLSLVAGEAVRLDATGEASRIPSVITGPAADEWSVGATAHAVIASVTDNHGERWSNKFYPIVREGMREGAFAWPYDVNKPRWWSKDAASLPAWLAGADVVQTLNEELDNGELAITVNLTRPSKLFVFYEDGATTPDWLMRDFIDSGERVVLSPDSTALPGDPGLRGSYQKVFRVWQRTVAAAGEYKLGALVKANVHSPPFYMYGIAAKAL